MVDVVRMLLIRHGHDPDAPRAAELAAVALSMPSPPAAPPQLLAVWAANHPGDRGNAAGADHLVVTRDFAAGRLKRRALDALCQPRRKFWGLFETPEREATCVTCIAIAHRHAFVLPAKRSG